VDPREDGDVGFGFDGGSRETGCGGGFGLGFELSFLNKGGRLGELGRIPHVLEDGLLGHPWVKEIWFRYVFFLFFLFFFFLGLITGLDINGAHCRARRRRCDLE
jgi:hypothetical protein